MCINVVIHLPPKLTPKSTYVITQLNRYFVGSPRHVILVWYFCNLSQQHSGKFYVLVHLYVFVMKL